MNDEQVANVARIVSEWWARDYSAYDCMRLAQRVGWKLDPDTHVVVRWDDDEPLTDDDLMRARMADPMVDNIASMVELDIEIEKFEEGLAADA